jgi:DTW domain-containing protein YfiP
VLTFPTHVLILRHPSERFRPSNTGRLAAAALAECTLVDLDRGARAPGVSFADDAHLVYPDVGPTAPPAAPPSQLVVLDGTWRQSRRMLHKLRGVLFLPRLSLPPPPPRVRLREPPHPHGMSTIEAIAAALGLFHGEDAVAPLYALYDETVARLKVKA